MNIPGPRIPETDVKATLEAAIAFLAQTSQEHAEEIGRYVRASFRPNAELVPLGVAMMYYQGCSDLEQKMVEAIYPAMMATLVNNIVLVELRKLPGVDDVFKRAEEAAASA